MIMSSNSDSGHSHKERNLAAKKNLGQQNWTMQDTKQKTNSHDDMDFYSNSSHANYSSGNDSNGIDSNGHESHEYESNGQASVHSSNSSSSGNGKDSALHLETTESNKSISPTQSLSTPSSSITYSLLSTSSEQDNPSTSGCSSEQSRRRKTQQELIKTLKDLKMQLPSEKCSKGKCSTVAMLQYALSCVKQVRANQEYYQQWTINEHQSSCMNLSTYTIQELETITEECSLKNPDTFSVAISYMTGRIIYISEQAPFILHCKRDVFKGTAFADILAPQDVSVFYSSTEPHRLPSWSSLGTSTVAASLDCTQQKSVFCRISGDRDRGHNIRYYPFRLTPYLMKVQDEENMEGHPCCVLLAEKIHSGYEAPRISPDKRIFTTRHTPSCIFQEVDERAIPLLGYLPQDLIGTSILVYLHPEDRPLMFAIHKKVLQCAGQTFDHSPLRFCARNGEYVTIDTSWSSFINPWSRKVSFIIGRHKVCNGPLNEDIFTAPKQMDAKPVDLTVLELTEQIHHLLLQPVSGSGNCLGSKSAGSNTSPDILRSITSSSDNNSASAEETKAHKRAIIQQMCKNGKQFKKYEQQMVNSLKPKPQPKKSTGTKSGFKVSKENSIDSVYISKELGGSSGRKLEIVAETLRKEPSVHSYQQINCLDSIIRYLESCSIPNTVKRKCISSSGTVSSNSDDGKQKVKKEVTNDRKGVAMTEEGNNHAVPVQQTVSDSGVNLTQDKDSYKKVGLTKEVLSAHTHREEQAFLNHFKDFNKFHLFSSPTGSCRTELRQKGYCPYKGGRVFSRATNGIAKHERRGKSKAKRIRQNGYINKAGLSTKKDNEKTDCGAPSFAWTTHCNPEDNFPTVPFHTAVPAFHISMISPGDFIPNVSDPSSYNLTDSQIAGGMQGSLQSPRNPSSVSAPMVAFLVPTYMFPEINSTMLPSYLTNQNSTEAPVFPIKPSPPLQTQDADNSFNRTNPTTLCPMPWSVDHMESSDSPFFNSRSSSPLQLNLLQLEDTLKSSERQEAVGVANQGNKAETSVWHCATIATAIGTKVNGQQNINQVEEPDSPSNNDLSSASSDLLDLLLKEDSHFGTGSGASGTGSAASGSLGSAFNGCSTSASGTRSSQSNNTSKYFGSIDSSENDLQAKTCAATENTYQFDYVLQDPFWAHMASADEKIMMTYQIPLRDMETVLKEDRDRLAQIQKHQPSFSEEQKKELADVHPWIHKGLLSKAFDIPACVGCSTAPLISLPYPYDVEIHDMDINGVLNQSAEAGEVSQRMLMKPSKPANENEINLHM
ncbi:period circadian protein homolog 2-like isoform X2 [Protopterus annectens]|uniref:period circadian protein homolog 2-like isoform X2 n=1 Tax=Protopterus annectens TaxID=7888 RepID=UPI001CFC2650|nr:period circadian protein homolog 2-like isoform X2 [Protopterus annectens]